MLLRIVGIFIGSAIAMLIAQLASLTSSPWSSSSSSSHAATTHRLMSECDGALAEISIQYTRGSEAALPVYRAFLAQLPADVIVDVTCPDEAAFDELRAVVGATPCSLRPIYARHEMTAWSRDRWLALPSDARSDRDGSAERTMLLAPRGEAGADHWPARMGDQRAAFDLASAHPASIAARRSDLYFDGGDFLADAQRVFVTPAVARQNVQRTVPDREALIDALRIELGRDVILLDEAPPHHAGMFMMSVGNRTMLVGDPRLARPMWSDVACELPGGADFSDETQRAFDAVAGRAAAEGYRVVRIPTAVAKDRKTYLTYVNVITDHRDGRHVVYVPQYRGASAMNEAAMRVWRSLGFEIRTVDCTSTYRLFGNLHCLVNVVRRT